MKNLINQISENTKIFIKGEEYRVLTKTYYSILEDSETEYIKCELTNHKVLVIIPSDNILSIGSIIPNFEYERLSKTQIKYDGKIFNKTGEGHQYIKKVEFGRSEDVEGECLFEDYESDNLTISLGILLDDNIRADVLAEILNLKDIIID